VGASVEVSGRVSGSGSCSVGTSATLCYVLGTAGTYNLRLSASGFNAMMRSITVEGSNPPCGCATVQTQELNIVLTPS
jgi:hypothetical protein